MHKRFLVLLSALALISAAVAANKPDVIVNMADDLGYGDLSGYGAKELATPNIDWLAAGGMRPDAGN